MPLHESALVGGRRGFEVRQEPREPDGRGRHDHVGFCDDFGERIFARKPS